MRFLANIIKFDTTKFELTLSLSFVEEDLILKLEQLEKEKSYVFEIKGVSERKDPITDQQRKFWFLCLSKIILASNEHPSGDLISSLHQTLKLSYFPVTYVKLGSINGNPNLIPVVPSINSIDKETLSEAINKLVQDYEEALGIKFYE